MTHFYKILFFILTYSFFSCNNKEKNRCELKKEVFNQIIENQEVKKLLHTEIEERTPFPIFLNDDNVCIAESNKYFYVDNKKLPESYIKVYSFIIDGNNINVELFYNVEGVNINCKLIKNGNDELKVVNVSFIEI